MNLVQAIDGISKDCHIDPNDIVGISVEDGSGLTFNFTISGSRKSHFIRFSISGSVVRNTYLNYRYYIHPYAF